MVDDSEANADAGVHETLAHETPVEETPADESSEPSKKDDRLALDRKPDSSTGGYRNSLTDSPDEPDDSGP